MNNKRVNRIISFFLASLLLVIPVLLPFSSFGSEGTAAVSEAVVQEDGSRSLLISTAEDLLHLAESCSLDTFSKNLSVSLKNDISLEGCNFVQIPYFEGNFYGNGYRITGLSLKENEVYTGFFGTVAENALISGLILEGTVKPEGILDAAGGIAGRNAGTIKGCRFLGTVDNRSYSRDSRGEQSTGGIAGVNEESGSILDCYVEGEVRGLKYTGGICGINRGTVSLSENHAQVNTRVQDKTPSIAELLEIRSVEDLQLLLQNKKVYASENTGGIAGCSDGVILYCSNSGSIGKEKNGYNVGGIAGSTSGFVYACSNSGTVSGNTNVGGILGQLIPCFRLEYGEAVLTKEDLNSIFESMDKLLTLLSDGISDSSEIVNLALSDVDTAMSAAVELEKELSQFANGKIEEADQIVETANGMLTDVNGMLTTVHEVLVGLGTVAQDANIMAGSLDTAMNHTKNAGEAISGGIKDISDTAKSSVNQIKDELNSDQFSIAASLDRNAAYLSELEEIRIIVLNRDDDGVMGEASLTAPEWTAVIRDLPVFDSLQNQIDYLVAFYAIPKETRSVYRYNTENVVWSRDTATEVYQVKIGEISKTAGKELTAEMQPYSVEMFWEDEFASIHRPSSVRVDVLAIDKTEGTATYYTSVTMKKADSSGGSEDSSYWVQQLELPVGYKNGDSVVYEFVPEYDVLSKRKYETVQSSAGNTVTFRNSYVGNSGGSGISRTISRAITTFTSVTSIAVSSGSQILSDVDSLIVGSSSELNYALADFKNTTAGLEILTSDLASVMFLLSEMKMPVLGTLPEFAPISASVDSRIEEINAAVSSLLGHVKDLNSTLNRMQKDMTAEAKGAVNGARDVTNTVFDLLEGVSLSLQTLVSAASDVDAVFDGVMEQEERSVGYRGCLMKCENTGEISACLAAGGIAGTMQLSGFPALEKTETEQEGITIPYLKYRALIRDCSSEGLVQAENGYAGLICGNEKMGSIIGCKASGVASSRKGDYVGGIAGFAHGVIRDCSARAVLNGRYYAGGIAGSGSDAESIYPASSISGCDSSAELGDNMQYCGAVSGSESGTFENNRFVSSSLKGVNGVSISGQFEPLEKETFEQLYPTLKDPKEISYKGGISENSWNTGNKLAVYAVCAVLILLLFWLAGSRLVAWQVARELERKTGK